MKYKVGDKVKIREDLRFTYNWNDTGVNIADDMARKAGKTATIKKVLQHHRYAIEEDGGGRTWHEDMFEGVVEEQKTMEYKAGDKVRVRKDLSADSYYGGVFCNSEMARKAGKVVTIKHKALYGRYEIEEDSWHWVSEMFEGIAEENSPQKDAANDPVSHPSHYTDGRIEVIDFIQDKNLDFARGNVVKYISRAGKKDKSKELEDLKKARQYCDFAIRELEQGTEKHA